MRVPTRTVGGHGILPGSGHVDARWWPPVLPGGGGGSVLVDVRCLLRVRWGGCSSGSTCRLLRPVTVEPEEQVKSREEIMVGFARGRPNGGLPA